MLQFLIRNPLILNILNNTEKPSNLDGLSASIIQILTDKTVNQTKQNENIKLLMNLFKELIASEYMFCNSHNNDCFVFLRERSRIAARMTGDFTISLCQQLGFNWFNQWCSKFYKFTAKDEKNVKKISEEANYILDRIFSTNFINDIPIEIRYIVKLIFTLSDQFEFGDYRYMLTGNLLILRMICPFISVPEFYHIVPDELGAPAPPARKCLTLVGKILSNLANNSFSVSGNSQKFELDEQLIPYKNIIYSNGNRYRQWIDQIMQADFSQFQLQEYQITPEQNIKQPQPGSNNVQEQFDEGSSDSEGFVRIQLRPQIKQVQDVINMQNCATNPNDSKILNSLNITPDMTPSEIIHDFLSQMFPMYDSRIIKDNQLVLQPNTIKLRYLSALHNSLINQKHAIYDLIQSMTHHDHDYISWFEQQAQEEKFKRFIEVYDTYYSQKSDKDQLIRYFNMLIIALQASPPTLVEIDYRPFDKSKAVSKNYQITYQIEEMQNKPVQGQLKVTRCQLFLLQQKQIKLHVTAPQIRLIKIQKEMLQIILNITHQTDTLQLQMTFQDESSWQQVISGLFEMCYNKLQVTTETFELSDENCVTVSNDSIFIHNNNKISDELYIIGLQMQISGKSVQLVSNSGQKVKFTLKQNENEFNKKFKQLNSIFNE